MYKEITRFLPEEILVYLRKSRSDDPSLTVEEVLEKHETILREWIERNLDGPIPEENWFREVVSGETISDRPEFQKVLKKIESPTIKAVLVVECPRLSRGDLEDCGRIIKLFRYTSTFVITPQRMYDLQEEFDREGFEREIKHGNYYLEYTKKILKRGIDYVVRMGGFVGSVAPYGYKKIRVIIDKKKIPTLEIIEEEARVVVMIFDWYVFEGLGYQRIADRLNEMGIKPRKAKAWGAQSVRKIIENEHYIGMIRYYAHKMVHEVQDQNIVKKRVAVDDYCLYKGLHPAIIKDDIFNRANARKNANPRVQKKRKLRNPLASLLYCECGHAMTFCYKRGIARFECPEQRRCGNSSIDASFLLEMVCDSIRQSIEDFAVELGSSNEDVIKKQEEKIAYLEKKLKDIQYKELSLWEKYTEESMPKSVFETLKVKYEDEKANTEKSLAIAVNEMPERINYEEKIAMFHEALDGINDESISAEVRNNLLKACIERIDYSREGAVRGNIEDLKEGQTYEKGWIQSEPNIEVSLRI